MEPIASFRFEPSWMVRVMCSQNRCQHRLPWRPTLPALLPVSLPGGGHMWGPTTGLPSICDGEPHLFLASCYWRLGRPFVTWYALWSAWRVVDIS